MRRRFASVLIVLIGFAATGVEAACNPGQSPFTDVADNAVFCSEALWLRNANVTIGCTGTTFCPTQNVPRSQMALFMKRLAKAVAPDIVYADVASAPGDLDGNGFGTCVTGLYTIPPTGENPRILSHATGTVSLLADAPADVFVAIQMSVNGGLFGTFGANPPRVTVPANQWTVVPVVGGQTLSDGSGALLVPGATYQWRIHLVRGVAGTTGEVTANRCQLIVHLPMDASL